MDSINATSLIVLQLSATALHGYIAYCFFLDRHADQKHLSFIYVMALCALFHLSDAVMAIAQLSNARELSAYAYLAHVAVEYGLCPFMVSNLIAEYTELPEKPNALARFLRRILLHGALLTKMVAALALFGFSWRLYGVISTNAIATATRFDIHAGSLVITLGLCWVLVVLSGLQPRKDTYDSTREPVLWTRGVLVALTILAVAADNLSGFRPGGLSETNFVHFVTVPFALVFAWYRYRFALVDVIVRWALGLVVIVTVVVIGYRTIPSLIEQLQPLAVYLLAIFGFFLTRFSGKALDNIWMPDARTVRKFNAQFSIQLAQCETPQQANALTETELGRLFQCSAWVNRETTEDTACTIELNDEPPVRIHLSYIRGLRPWFSQARNIANEAALHLQSTLHVMEWRDIQHRTELNNQALQTLAARSELDAMRAQIRPHFFFNVLNTMHSYIVEDPVKAQLVIELLADLMRSIAKTTDQDTYPLSQEIELARVYLNIEQARFGDRLNFQLDVDEELLDHPIPPFSIQPLVENAVKFSVDSQLGTAEIRVAIQRREDYVEVTVTDNGTGLQDNEKSKGLGMALSNIRDRLEKLYQGDASLQLEADDKQGTRATLSIPWHAIPQSAPS